MGILFSPEIIFIISIILFLISIHSLILCVINYNKLGGIVTFFFLLYGMYIFYLRCHSSVELFNG
jgi:hypothetical protein